ncbi:hypothetical protein LRR18_16365, partial [Mangrovimonas sp. AS39]|uniref:hypothetical protein n=1 Tax=Mangrovimonas futianensis TaxID=2895523 RepID=UPI001E2C675A
KEINFRALEQKYQQQLAQERSEKEKLALELQQRQQNTSTDDDEDSDPYVDHKRLRKEQAKFGQQIKQETQSEIQRAVKMALNEERKQNWMKNNSDFYDVMAKAENFAQSDPELAETILEMPEGFERQKLVYHTIKARGLHKPQQKEPTIQEKIDANRRSPYYQPTGVSAAPYAQVADYSSGGQKQAYEKMQQLKNQLRL